MRVRKHVLSVRFGTKRVVPVLFCSLTEFYFSTALNVNSSKLTREAASEIALGRGWQLQMTSQRDCLTKRRHPFVEPRQCGHREKLVIANSH
jgi:hypothetical protein